MVESAAFPGGYYRNAFEAPHESQDSGSSAQIDTEVTASENSTTPARKRINLNPDDEDPYGVRRQAIPLYNMSQSESKDLIHRLKRELEQTKIVLKNAELLNVRSTSRNILETPAPSEKQYRAALLKNKFADIILKAREKTLPQNSNKGDPEKLRKEREELELQMQKERARLQAEAEAAEDARRQAEAEAAAEAAAESKHGANCGDQRERFLEDLEMLSSSAPEQLPSSVDETSPERGLDPLGSFNFRGINPLEQLGLYMKQDDDDEEGPEAPIARAGLV
ncbi:hypothetical protein HID58_084262 [Brassica napus]|uniref:Uncharacterized protein n=1 Tax=Brassica napus TaxID=3708 RepID=A0ABQ7XLN8_BRANA|nr:hypothetical protein HID58_084262 [Brassica napus]